MALWTDIIDPATLTGYVRQSLADYERSQGSLARWLPNVEVPDVSVRFVVGRNGLVDEARYRAYDAEPEVGKTEGGKRVTIDLPAISQEIPVSEYNQLRLRNAPDSQMLSAILGVGERVARAVADRTERLRGTVLATGKATIDQHNFKTTDDFGRDADLTVTAPTLWSDPAADRIAQAEDWLDVWDAKNGGAPGAAVMDRNTFRALARGDSFRVQLLNGGSRPATQDDVRAIWAAAGLPDIYVYNRKTSGGKVIPDGTILFLPAPGETSSTTPSELGATYWGQTLTASLPDYGLAAEEMPGIVVGTYRNPKPPAIAEVISDAINLPVLGDANLSMAVKVL